MCSNMLYIQIIGTTRERNMILIFKSGSIEIWQVSEAHGFDYYVYGVTQGGDPRVCPSIGMAYEVAASGAL